MPSFFNFELRVVRLRPKSAAAPVAANLAVGLAQDAQDVLSFGGLESWILLFCFPVPVLDLKARTRGNIKRLGRG